MMKNKVLPKLTLKLTVRNPDYVAGSTTIEYYVVQEKECEVLTVNFNSGSMRIRYTHMGKVETTDTSAKQFFEQFNMVSV